MRDIKYHLDNSWIRTREKKRSTTTEMGTAIDIFCSSRWKQQTRKAWLGGSEWKCPNWPRKLKDETHKVWVKINYVYRAIIPSCIIEYCKAVCPQSDIYANDNKKRSWGLLNKPLNSTLFGHINLFPCPFMYLQCTTIRHLMFCQHIKHCRLLDQGEDGQRGRWRQ